MSLYKDELRDGWEVSVPSWSPSVALENLTKAGKVLGANEIVSIATLDIRAVIIAVMNAVDPAQASAVIKHFVCSARLDGKRIIPEDYDGLFGGDLAILSEVFAHVVHAQYSDFFERGLGKAPSQEE